MQKGREREEKEGGCGLSPPTDNHTQEAWLPQPRNGFPSLELSLSAW